MKVAITTAAKLYLTDFYQMSPGYIEEKGQGKYVVNHFPKRMLPSYMVEY